MYSVSVEFYRFTIEDEYANDCGFYDITLSQKMHQLCNGVAQNYRDRF